ncbi:hypothetical protein GJAV_G00227930 [Gymnothorax javanicus]|nr:hypothetical protein GJAV_G00227930 [Gymnothorax javanicus]
MEMERKEPLAARALNPTSSDKVIDSCGWSAKLSEPSPTPGRMPEMSARTWDPVPQTAAARDVSQQKDPGVRRSAGTRDGGEKKGSFFPRRRRQHNREEGRERLRLSTEPGAGFHWSRREEISAVIDCAEVSL